MSNKYLYNNYLNLWKKMDERDEQVRTPTIPVRPRMFLDQSVKSWRERTTLELLSDALGEALEALSPRD